MSEGVSQQRRRRRWPIVAASVVIALGAVVLWRVSVARRAFDPLAIPDAIPAALRSQQLGREEVWRKASFEGVASAQTKPLATLESEADGLASKLAPMVDDPDGLLSVEAKNRLLDAVATEAMVRTQVNPEAYIDLVESSPQYRWIEPTEDQWRRAGLWGLLQESGGPMPKTTVEACRRLWPQIMADGYRFARLGVEPTGVRIKVSVIRSSRQPFELFDLYSEGQRHYWLDVPMRSSLFKFREPVRTPEEALAGRPSLIVAESNELIETDNGLLATWRLFWYLDPDSGRWVCHYGVVAGGRLVKAFF